MWVSFFFLGTVEGYFGGLPLGSSVCCFFFMAISYRMCWFSSKALYFDSSFSFFLLAIFLFSLNSFSSYFSFFSSAACNFLSFDKLCSFCLSFIANSSCCFLNNCCCSVMKISSLCSSISCCYCSLTCYYLSCFSFFFCSFCC